MEFFNGPKRLRHLFFQVEKPLLSKKNDPIYSPPRISFYLNGRLVGEVCFLSHSSAEESYKYLKNNGISLKSVEYVRRNCGFLASDFDPIAKQWEGIWGE